MPSNNDDAEIAWIHDSVEISPEAFFNAFKMANKRDAHRRYYQAIMYSNLKQIGKDNLFRKFELWKENEGIQFWLDRQSESSAKKTATHLIKGSEPYAEQSIRQASWRAQSTVTLSVGASNKHDLDDTGETDNIHNNPLESVDPVSAVNSVYDANQASASSTAHLNYSDKIDLPMDVAKRKLTLEDSQVGIEEENVTKRKKSITKAALRHSLVQQDVDAEAPDKMFDEISFSDGSSASFLPGTQEDSTGEFSVVLDYPRRIVRLVGPGQESSTLKLDHWLYNHQDISKKLMTSRATMVKDHESLQMVHEILYVKTLSEHYLVVVEVKPPSATQSELDDDYIKLPNLMKSALDWQINQGYSDGTVVGFLIQGWKTLVFYIALEHEAIYELRNVGQFHLIADHTQMAQVLSICPVLMKAKEMVKTTMKMLRRRPLSKQSYKNDFQRPSYSIKPIMIHPNNPNNQESKEKRLV
ncbi:hypothetical protein BGW38_001631 [Lunasporangiospora selenospora]|uniref:Uncharacterized protein n=1 Tax=Lunasporangiospora selenospora TaxID=979761 RepID=A0A9P6KDE4_9FUNG|nr:hypothetical protein BGW38_001631 [Lunasporangiospora selenospora]